MGTRSLIAIHSGNDAVTAVYCHWDGYPEHNGKILTEHYQTAEKVIELLSYGDISSLGENIGTPHDFNSRVDGICTFYNRDRGESDVDARTFPTADLPKNASDCGAEYVYLFKEKEWYVSAVRYGSDSLRFERVTDVLKRESAQN